MPRNSRTIFIIFIIFYPFFSLAQTTAPTSESETINYIIKETSIQEELNRSISELESQFSQNPFGLPASKNEQMMNLFANTFEPKAMRTTIKETFREQYNADHANATVNWLNDSTTQKVLDYQKEFYTLQGIRKRIVNEYELEKNPVSQARTALIDSLAQQMSAAPMEVESRAIIFRAMISALSKLSDQRSFSEAQIDTFVNNFRNQMQSQIGQQLTNRFLVKYHGLDSKYLRDYMSFYETEAGSWLSNTTSQSVHGALESASEKFLNSLNTIQ